MMILKSMVLLTVLHAVTTLKNDTPDLILLNLMMLDLNGWQVHDTLLRSP